MGFSAINIHEIEYIEAVRKRGLQRVFLLHQIESREYQLTSPFSLGLGRVPIFADGQYGKNIFSTVKVLDIL